MFLPTYYNRSSFQSSEPSFEHRNMIVDVKRSHSSSLNNGLIEPSKFQIHPSFSSYGRPQQSTRNDNHGVSSYDPPTNECYRDAKWSSTLVLSNKRFDSENAACSGHAKFPPFIAPKKPKVVWRHLDPENDKYKDEKDMVVLNVDGSSNKNLNRAGYGGVIRDHKGKWLIGFSGHINYTDSLNAELLAILNGLSLAWEKGYRKVNCRSDCLQAVKFFQDSELQPYEHVASVVDCIKELRARDWLVTFEHVYREGNQCADYMAKLGANSMNMKCMEPHENPPISLLPLLKADEDKTEYTRA